MSFRYLTDEGMVFWGLIVLVKQYLQNTVMLSHCVSLHLVDITEGKKSFKSLSAERKLKISNTLN